MTAIIALLCGPPLVRPGVAQDASGSQISGSSVSESQPVEPDIQPDVSREEWRERVRAAKKRAQEISLERRQHPERFVPPPEDLPSIATERVLGDDSLQPGDIVSTNKGLFVFRGRTDQPRSNADFLPLSPR